MHKCTYTHEVKVISGKLWMHVTAHYRDKHLKVYRECEDGRKLSRNLYYRNMAGYMVSFPGDMEDHGYGCGFYESILEPWGKAYMGVKFDFQGFWINKENEEIICRAYPDFRYVLDKCENLTTAEVIRIFSVWRDRKNRFVMEWLLSIGWKQMALNHSLYKLKPESQKAVIKFIREKPERHYSLQEIQIMLKEGISERELYLYQNWCCNACGKVSYKVFKYLDHKPGFPCHNRQLYRDYIYMAKKAGHNIKDKYWAFPKSLRQAHDKVSAELKAIRDAEDARKQAVQQEKYSAVIKSWLEKKLKTKTGVSVYIPADIDDIKAQAEALSQCLISGDYVQKVIDRRCVLVFICYGKRRMATAEFSLSGKLVQFYGNEARRDDCAPSESAKKALDQWKETYFKKAA